MIGFRVERALAAVQSALGAQRFSPQIWETLVWISSICTKKDLILLETPKGKQHFTFSFPLRPRDLPKEVSASQVMKPTFIIRASKNTVLKQEGWATLFSSPLIEVLESLERPVSPKPLRWDLNLDERKELLQIARESLTKFVLDGNERYVPQTIQSPRLRLRSDVDVAYWVDGHLRGSRIIENTELFRGVPQAAILASKDPRFKAITEKELSKVTIEITVMRNLRIPLSREERVSRELYTDKGFRISHGNRTGWFLPEIFNVRRFSGTPEFLAQLAFEKGGLEVHSDSATVVLFDVEDFVELANEVGAPHSLQGPVIPSDAPEDSGRALAEMAADWLLRHQDEEGNFRPVVSAWRDTSPTVDWARQAFVTWALAELGVVLGESAYIEAVKRSLAAITGPLQRRPQEIVGVDLVRAYLGKTALALGDATRAAELVQRLLPFNRDNDIITLSHVLGFAREVLSQEEFERTAGPELEQRLKRTFLNDLSAGTPVELALYAELGSLFQKTDPAFSKRVIEWMSGMQNEDGSFPRAMGSLFRYVRGTGKVFEVLALEKKQSEKFILPALSWLASMQYTERNLFFVPTERRNELIGGFRHDDNNPDAWADSAGHVLLGIARVLKTE